MTTFDPVICGLVMFAILQIRLLLQCGDFMSRTTLGALLLLWVISAPATGQTKTANETAPNISRAIVGFSLRTRENTWTPMYMTIENPGPAADAEIVIGSQRMDGQRLPGLTRTKLRLPAKSTTDHISYVQEQCGQEYALELRVNDRLVDQRRIDSHHLSPRRLFVLGLSTHGDGFTCDIRNDLTDMVGRVEFNNTYSMSRIPDRWQGLASVDAIVLGDRPEMGISVSQEQAVLDWVRAGGILILCPAVADDRYDGALFADISPVRVVGRKKVRSLAPFEAKYGAIDWKDTRIHVSETQLIDGKVHMQIDQLPLMISRREGLGVVVFVAFDISAKPVSAMRNMMFFYQDLLALRGGLPKIEGTDLAGASSAKLDEIMGVRIPPLWILAVCLGVNFVVVALVLAWKSQRREIGFVILVIVAPIIALIINFIDAFSATTPHNSAGAIHVIQSASGESRCAGSGYHALFTKNEVRQDIRFPDEATCFPGALITKCQIDKNRKSAVAAFGGTVETNDSDLKSINQLHVRARAVSKFQTDFITRMDGPVHATASYNAEGISVEIANNSSKLLRHGFVLSNRNAIAIDDLSPGEKTRVQLDGGTSCGMMGAFSRTALKSKGDAQRDAIVRSLFATKQISEIADTGALVCAWFDGMPDRVRPSGIEGAPQPGTETLWIIHADAEQAGGEILLPKGAAAMRVKAMRGRLITNGAWAAVAGNSILDITFQAPESVRPIRAKRITLFFVTGQAPANVLLKAYNCETERYDVIAPKSPDGSATMRLLSKTSFDIPNPEDYLSNTSGEVRIRMQMQLASNTNVPTGSARQPIIEDFDIEIEGIVE